MQASGIVAIVVLVLAVALVLRGIRGHGHKDGSGADSGAGPDDIVGGGD
ncbi:MAG TPA: hypothetical protein VF680_00405 [Allosphingosinicella sp.]